MKGFATDYAVPLLIVLCVIAAMFAYFALVRSSATTSGENAQERLYGIGINGLVIFGGLGGLPKKRKGLELSTGLIATIVFVVVVALVLFLLFAGVQANAGSTAGGFFYGTFDDLMSLIGGR